MTLIKIADNNLTGIQKYKSDFWERQGVTPNEAYKKSEAYRSLANKFIRQTGLAVSPKWFEVRVISDHTSVVWTPIKEWFKYGSFCDKVFWMFMKPVEDLIDGKPYTFYVLEPYECMRVQGLLRKNHGYHSLPKSVQPFLIPVECCSIAWNETANGVSEHLHYRPEEVKTQKQIDRENLIREEAKKLLEMSFDISSNAAMGEAATKLYERTVRKS